MTVELTRIERHFGEGLVALVPPFWGRPRIAALTRSFLNRVQEIEDAAWEVLGAFNVRTADPARLKTLGKIVGQSNLGWSTETFRAVIMARIATNRSHGTEDDIIRVLRLITQSTEAITITPMVPATMSVEMGEPVSADHKIAISFLLPKARGAGIRLNFIAPTEDAWIFDSSAAAVNGASTFDSSATPLTGAGTLGSAITL